MVYALYTLAAIGAVMLALPVLILLALLISLVFDDFEQSKLVTAPKKLHVCAWCDNRPAIPGTFLCGSCGAEFEHDLEDLLARRAS
jgi:hypothetical protein